MSLDRWLRTSIGRWAAPVFALVLGVHLATRSGSWRYEWLRGVLLLTFSCVFLGPLAAGFATWEGSRWARAELVDSLGRPPGAAPLRASFALDVWLLAPLLVAAVAMSVVAKSNGLPGWPTGADLAPLLAAISLLIAWSTIGFAIGWRSGSTVLAAPLVAGSAFALTIATWGGPGLVMEVGGTFTALVGLRIKPEVIVGQVAFWLGLTVAGLAIIRMARHRLAVPSLGLLIGLIIAGSGFQLTQHADGLLFAGGPASVRCAPIVTGTDVCLAPGYERHRATAEGAVRQALVRWRAAGLEVPTRFSQSPDPGRSGFVWLDERDVLLGDVNDLEWQLVNSLFSPSCDTYDDLDARHAFDQVASAVVRDPLGTVVDGREPTSVPALPSEQVAATRRSAQVLAACGTSPRSRPHR